MARSALRFTVTGARARVATDEVGVKDRDPSDTDGFGSSWSEIRVFPAACAGGIFNLIAVLICGRKRNRGLSSRR